MLNLEANAAELKNVNGSVSESETSFAWVSPDGTRVIIRREISKIRSSDRFHDFNDGTADLELPEYRWAEPSYLWSPTGRWIAAVINEQMPSNWDEIPVGSPNLKNFVAGYDGRTGRQLWSEEVDTSFAPFEWSETRSWKRQIFYGTLKTVFVCRQPMGIKHGRQANRRAA